jgi:hypothetical protein
MENPMSALIDRLRYTWRSFITTPRKMTLRSVSEAMCKRYDFDPGTRDIFSDIGLTPEVFRQPGFYLLEWLCQRKGAILIENMANDEDEGGPALLRTMAGLDPDSQEYAAWFAAAELAYRDDRIRRLESLIEGIRKLAHDEPRRR